MQNSRDDDDINSENIDFYKFDRLTNQHSQNSSTDSNHSATPLSILFASFCIIDLFGVFPIIALPSAIISCGLYGIPLIVFVISLQMYTAVILGRCWIIAEKLYPQILQKTRYPYAAIAEITYGRRMSLFVTILLNLTVFGGGIPNILVASQNLELLGLRITNGDFHFSFCYWLIILGVVLCPILWLGSPKNMKLLATTSVITVSSVAILTWYCISTENPMKNSLGGFLNNTISKNDTFRNVMDVIKNTEYPKLEDLLKAYGIIAFQFDIHPMLLTIQVDMENKKGIGKAVGIGILFTISMSAITTIFVVFNYGANITPNILESLPRSIFLYVTISLVTLQLCLSSPVGSSALFQYIEEFFETSRNFTYKRCIIRSALVFLAVTIGELLPRFDLVMGLIGGTLTGPLIFILPPLFYTKMKSLEEIYDNEIIRIQNTNDQEHEKEIYADDYIITTYGSMPLVEIRNNRKGTMMEFLIESLSILRFICSDCIISVSVVVFGLCATFASTYCNMSDITSIVQWSPCLSNTTFNIFSN